MSVSVCCVSLGLCLWLSVYVFGCWVIYLSVALYGCGCVSCVCWCELMSVDVAVSHRLAGCLSVISLSVPTCVGVAGCLCVCFRSLCVPIYVCVCPYGYLSVGVWLWVCLYLSLSVRVCVCLCVCQIRVVPVGGSFC